MSPVSHCYFDYYQANPAMEPLAIGGYTTLKEVYGYEPIPKELNKQEAKHILGAQGNVWTEYMPIYEHVEYMAVPRMTALSEVVWSPKTHRNWQSFNQRIQSFLKRVDAAGHNYSLGSNEVRVIPWYEKKSGHVIVSMKTDNYNPTITYTLDGSLPTKESLIYYEPIVLESSSYIRAALLKNNAVTTRITDQEIIIHKGFGKSVSYIYPYHEKYSADGKYNLVNGIKGSNYFSDEKWQGFHEHNLEAIVDLEIVTEVSTITIDFLSRISSWIFQPKIVTISISKDGKEYFTIKKIENVLSEKTENDEVISYSYNGISQSARYIKIVGESIGKCPDWHMGGGKKAWLFADEIIID